jgi:serine/threonine protein kinase
MTVNEDQGEQLQASRAVPLPRLGPFRLLEELGTGAMGTVYFAEDVEEERRVALKVLHPHLLSNKDFFQRFQREAQAGQQVRHDNVVRTLDCSFHVVDAQPYCVLVMEYVRGRTLRDLLGDLTCVPENLVREIGRQVAKGLAAIWSWPWACRSHAGATSSPGRIRLVCADPGL